MEIIKEIEQYRRFAIPAELHKAINTLRGIVGGITMDVRANEQEMEELINWCTLHRHLIQKHPFNEILPLIDSAHQDGVITHEEAQDILWLCNNFSTEHSYYDDITSALQYLAGLLHGVLADNEITDHEIKMLRSWVDKHSFLRGCYPFDEIDSVLMAVLADQMIDQDERNMLKAFFSYFIDLSALINLNESEMDALRDKYHVDGVCAACPDIVFPRKTFCFTGQSRKAKRAEFADIVVNNGGIFRDTMSRSVNYLIVGDGGNPCWAYACYGRKIEEAVALRKEGHKIVIVHESDFWDALN